MTLLRLALATGVLAISSACAHAATPGKPVNMLPPVSLPRYPDGVPVNLDSERGNVLVLDIWATWCEPCKAALPEWDALAAVYRDRGVRIYAVSVDKDLNKVGEFLKQVPLQVPVLLDRDAAMAEGVLRLSHVPTAFIVDKQGVIRAKYEAYAPGDVKGFVKAIDPLLLEK
ncbi:MAG TPA: TlpA disulfide reductase family protein [Myxococcales bacterium]|nr:TlpA disulfide reductase family protein [Myxococcales bacterium]